MRRHKAWRGGSKAPHSGEPAIALDLSLVNEKYPKLTSPSIQNEGLGHHFGGFGASFSSYFGCLGGFWLPSASWEVFWAALGRVLVASWGRLGAQDGPSNLQVTPQN